MVDPSAVPPEVRDASFTAAVERYYEVAGRAAHFTALEAALEAALPFLVAQEQEARAVAEEQVEDWKRRYRLQADEVSRRGRRLEAAEARCAELEAELERWRNGLEDGRA